MQVLVQAVVMLAGVAYQTSQGYFHYELGLYVKELFGLRLLSLAS